MLALGIASFVVNFAFGVIMPFLPFYLGDLDESVSIPHFGVLALGTQLGLMASGFMLARSFLAPTFGQISDNYGRKPVIVVGLIFYGFLSALFGLCATFWMLFATRFMQGVASAAVWPVAEALVVDSAEPDRVGKDLGFFILSMQLGWTISPFVGSAFYGLLHFKMGVDAVWSYRWIFFLMGAVSFLSAALGQLLIVDPKDPDAKFSIGNTWRTAVMLIITPFLALRGRRRIRTDDEGNPLPEQPNPLNLRRLLAKPTNMKALYVFAAVNGFAFSMIFPLMALVFRDYYSVAPENVGILMGVAGVAALVSNPSGGVLADKYGRMPVLTCVGIIGGISFLFASLKWSLFAFVVVLFITQSMNGIRMPVFRALQADLIPESRRGEEFGVVQFFFNIGAVAGPIVGGVLYDFYFGDTWVFRIGPLDLHFVGLLPIFGLTCVLAVGSLICLVVVLGLDPQPDAVFVLEHVPVSTAAGSSFSSTSEKPAAMLQEPRR